MTADDGADAVNLLSMRHWETLVFPKVEETTPSRMMQSKISAGGSNGWSGFAVHDPELI